MDTQDGADDSRRGSVSHKQPSLLPAQPQTQSPSCRRSNNEKADEPSPAAIVASGSQHAFAPTASPSRGRMAKLYAYQQTASRHVSSLARSKKLSAHRPRQSSTDITALAPVSSFSRNAALTDGDIEQHLIQLLQVETAPEEGDAVVTAYAKASRHPPITHESLSELDITRIINNPKLRHDVNFDKELHFRPNLDGSRGRQKLKAADDYWKALVAELLLYRLVGTKLLSATTAQDQEYWSRMMHAAQKRMPVVFDTVRDILKTLVPERDQPVVDERIDVAMIMQEISKGVFDMMSLANWLATLLKAHCAPMRDEWIDQMVAQVQKSIEFNDQKRLAVGLRQLLGILEAMKLDVANHQIRHLRAMLIEDGVSFQTKYHLTRIHYGRIDIHRAKKWYFREYRNHATPIAQPDRLTVFVSALFKSLLGSSSLSSLPENFSLDSDRLRSFRLDLHAIVHTQLCLDVLDRLLPTNLASDARLAAHAALRSSLPAIIPETRRPVECASNIAVEMVRIAAAYQPVPGSQFDGVKVAFAERLLTTSLPAGSHAFFLRNRQLLLSQLPLLEKLVRDHLALTPLALHDAIFSTPPVSPAALFDSAAQQQQARREDRILDSILRRVAHVAILHWHIWGPIVYDVALEEGPGTPSAWESEGSSASGSDTESEAGSDVSELSSAGVVSSAVVSPVGGPDTPKDEPSLSKVKMDGEPERKDGE